jgi:protein-arginine kinase activator protein McsA
MTEKTQEKTENIKEAEDEKEVPVEELNPVEEQARALGWKPKEEFEADPNNAGKKWRTAEDFMDRKSLFDRLDSYNKEVRDLKRGIAALSEHNKKIERLAYEKALRELREERAKAIEEQDLERVEAIRDRMEELKEQHKIAQSTPPAPQSAEQDPRFIQWVENNKWYKTDEDMRVFAEGYAIHLWNTGVRDPETALPMIEKKVKEIFPTKFRNPNKDRASSLEGGQRKESKKSEDFKLTEAEERILTNMLRAGAPITREEYIKQLKETRS